MGTQVMKNNNKPIISLCLSAYRPKNWMSLYKSVGKNTTVDFEIIFVGPNAPDYELPKNFRFIKSMVKPCQCREIAHRNAIGDFVMMVADDVVFNGESPLDSLYKVFNDQGNEKMIVSPRYILDGKLQPLSIHKWDKSIVKKGAPYFPVSGLMKRKVYNEIGGTDKNFIGIMCDLELALRIYNAGGGLIFSSDVTVEEKQEASDGGSLCVEYYELDNSYLKNLWIKDKKILSKRAKVLEPYKDEDLYTISQGPRGRWRGNNLLIIEEIIDSKKMFQRIFRVIMQPKKYSSYLIRIYAQMQKQFLGKSFR